MISVNELSFDHVYNSCNSTNLDATVVVCALVSNFTNVEFYPFRSRLPDENDESRWTRRFAPIVGHSRSGKVSDLDWSIKKHIEMLLPSSLRMLV